MKKILMSCLVVLATWVGVAVFSPANVNAAVAGCDDSFLTFRPWYHSLTKNNPPNCDIKQEFADEKEFQAFIWTIVLNILSNLFSAVGYLAIGFLIYGGYMYVLSRGSTDRIVKAKKIIISAVIGLVICILASVIANTIVTIITGATGA